MLCAKGDGNVLDEENNDSMGESFITQSKREDCHRTREWSAKVETCRKTKDWMKKNESEAISYTEKLNMRYR